MMRPFTYDIEWGKVYIPEPKFIKQPLKKNKQKGWRSYRNTYLKNKENYGIYVYNGQDGNRIFVLTRTN